MHETCRKPLVLYFIDCQLVLKSQVLLREPQELLRNSQVLKVLKQEVVRKPHKLVRKPQLKKVLRKWLVREPQERDLLKKFVLRKEMLLVR